MVMHENSYGIVEQLQLPFLSSCAFKSVSCAPRAPCGLGQVLPACVKWTAPAGYWRGVLCSAVLWLPPFGSFPLPICAHPLVSWRRIIKQVLGTWFKEKESDTRGLPVPRSQCGRHLATGTLPLGPFEEQRANLTNRAVHCADSGSRAFLVLYKLLGKHFLFPFIFAIAACRVQKASSESR